ncbi:MAG: hypothetical protein Q9222_003171 [Ikaeria aurantiellina]
MEPRIPDYDPPPKYQESPSPTSSAATKAQENSAAVAELEKQFWETQKQLEESFKDFDRITEDLLELAEWPSVKEISKHVMHKIKAKVKGHRDGEAGRSGSWDMYSPYKIKSSAPEVAAEISYLV